MPSFEPVSAAYSPLRGVQHGFEFIDSADRVGLMSDICPGKYRTWIAKIQRAGSHLADSQIDAVRPCGGLETAQL